MKRFDMYIPDDLEDLLTYLDSSQDRQTGIHLLANGSDLIPRIQRRQVDPKILVDLSGLSELNFVIREEGTIRIGALTTLSDMISSPVLNSRYDVFRDVAEQFGGPSILNVATIGGNICAASSSEDLLPVLLVLEAQVRLKSRTDERVLRLEDFVKGKRVIDLKPGEILVETMFRELDESSTCAFEKVGMRNSLIIAFVNAAVYLKVHKETRRVENVRIALNRVSGKIPQRAKATEDKLRGSLLNEIGDGGVKFLRDELELGSDFRASAQYRTHVAGILFKRAAIRCVGNLTGEKVIG